MAAGHWRHGGRGPRMPSAYGVCRGWRRSRGPTPPNERRAAGSPSSSMRVSNGAHNTGQEEAAVAVGWTRRSSAVASAATTGLPAAMASGVTRLCSSTVSSMQKMSQRAQKSRTSWSVARPGKVTRARLLNSSARCFKAPPQEPSPMISPHTPRRRPTNRTQACVLSWFLAVFEQRSRSSTQEGGVGWGQTVVCSSLTALGERGDPAGAAGHVPQVPPRQPGGCARESGRKPGVAQEVLRHEAVRGRHRCLSSARGGRQVPADGSSGAGSV